jgi:hypothetical protein
MIEKVKDGLAITCFSCNRMNYKDGGVMRPMSKKEATRYLKDEAVKVARDRERSFKAAFSARNENRKSQGLDVLTPAQFKEQQAKEYRATIRLQSGGGK